MTAEVLALPSAVPEMLADTQRDAEAARLSVSALAELLRGCPPDYQLSAGLFLGLVVSVQMYLENVVDGLRVVHTAGGSPWPAL